MVHMSEQQREFQAFFAAQSPGLVRMCWAVTLDREQARDVAQETMARAWREWDRLGDREPGRLDDTGAPIGRGSAVDDSTGASDSSGGGQVALPSPAAWCRTVALNLIRSQWRRDRVAREAVLPEAEPVGLDASDLDLRDALAQLSDRQREAVVMFHLLDLPIAGCAEVMGLSEPTVKTHLQRGRDRLRQLLAESELENAET